jgi:hypothetical protein
MRPRGGTITSTFALGNARERLCGAWGPSSVRGARSRQFRAVLAIGLRRQRGMGAEKGATGLPAAGGLPRASAAFPIGAHLEGSLALPGQRAPARIRPATRWLGRWPSYPRQRGSGLFLGRRGANQPHNGVRLTPFPPRYHVQRLGSVAGARRTCSADRAFTCSTRYWTMPSTMILPLSTVARVGSP